MMKNNLLKKIRPEYLFAAALIVIPAFLFQENVILKWVHVFLFIMLSSFSGKKIRIIPNLIMLSGITAANILTPLGEVLFYILNFPVTSGALINGLEKSALLIGMIYISKTALSGDLSNIWKKRNIFTDLFYFFEKIMEGDDCLSEENDGTADYSEGRPAEKSSNKSDENKFNKLHTVSALINDLIRKTDKKLLAIEKSSRDQVPFQRSEDPYLYSNVLSWGFALVFISLNWGLFFL